MADNPYDVLGVPRDADQPAIRSAYRKLARKHHPDLNPGDKAAEERFKAVAAANDLLSDPVKRAAFDRGEVDVQGQGDPARAEQPRYRDFAEGQAGRRYRASGGASGRPAGGWGANEDELGDIFGTIFGEHGREGFAGAAGPARGRDERYALAIDLLIAVAGGTRRRTLPDGRTLDVRIPPGLEDGQTLRLRGQGAAGRNGGSTGDALIQVSVSPHPFFRREGQTIYLDLPVTVREAVLGGRVSVPTPSGAVAMTVPPGSDSGRQLRLRGRGVPAHDGLEPGDLHVSLRIVIGQADAALEAFLKSWSPSTDADPRRTMMGDA